jgi:uncharacterized protein with ATP-grasp and redox domains
MRNLLDSGEFKLYPECYPCFLRQTVLAVNLGTDDEDLKLDIIRAVLGELDNADINKSPAHATTTMHRSIRGMLGTDPFERIKDIYNEKAIRLYPELKKIVGESDDPLHTALKLAIAGNVIDFGIYTSVDIEGTVDRALGNPLAVDDYPDLRAGLTKSERILYLLDNAGEIVFDRILIEELVSLGKEVTAVVKGSPVINDCTLTDAGHVGLDRVCNVMDNGSDAVGTIVETTSSVFRKRFEDKGYLVVSKGQGNFETLMHETKEIFFLFQSKCSVLSRFLELPEGSMLLLYSLRRSVNE